MQKFLDVNKRELLIFLPLIFGTIIIGLLPNIFLLLMHMSVNNLIELMYFQMVYLLETKLSENKSVFLALSNIYGIGQARSFKICKKLGLSINFKVKDLSEEQALRISKLIESSGFIVTSELRKIQTLNLKRLVQIKSYRGIRRIQGLPVRGQRTHTNARSVRRKDKSPYSLGVRTLSFHDRSTGSNPVKDMPK